MKKIFKLISILLLSVLLGAGSLALLIKYPFQDTTIINGPWKTDLSIGASQTGLYTKARVAVIGLFAMKKTEAVYFIADSDSDGLPLNSENDYRIEGRDFKTGWWSITIVGPDFHLIKNTENKYSYNQAEAARNNDKSYTIKLSSKQKKGNWIPTGSGQFYINLRLYNPSPEVINSPDKIELPAIIKEKSI